MNARDEKKEMLTFSHTEPRCLKCIHPHKNHWESCYTIMEYILDFIFISNSQFKKVSGAIIQEDY